MAESSRDLVIKFETLITSALNGVPDTYANRCAVIIVMAMLAENYAKNMPLRNRKHFAKVFREHAAKLEIADQM